MRFSFQSGVRNDLLQEITDQTFSPVKNRNSKSFAKNYGSSDLPHTLTERISYTVPANKYAIISGFYLHSLLVTARTVAGLSYFNVQFDPVAGALTNLFALRSVFQNVGDSKEIAIGSQFIMHGGDKITVSTADLATGGNINYSAAFMVFEADA